jgi:hypothetical protein
MKIEQLREHSYILTLHDTPIMIGGKRYKRVYTSTVKLEDGSYENMVFAYRNSVDWSGIAQTRSDAHICPFGAVAALSDQKLVVGKRQRGHGRRRRYIGARP